MARARSTPRMPATTKCSGRGRRSAGISAARAPASMMLVYNLDDVSNLYDRFAGVAGSAYVVAGRRLQRAEAAAMCCWCRSHRRRRAARRQYRLPEAHRSSRPGTRSDRSMCSPVRIGSASAALTLMRHALLRARHWISCLAKPWQIISRGRCAGSERIVTVIQSILFFVLGFLCAGFLALMVAPAIWRRAVALTRKRIEASVPLTLDRDPGRQGPHARRIRHVDAPARNEHQGVQGEGGRAVVEINRNREELKRLAVERDEPERGAFRARSQGRRAARRASPARGPVAAPGRQARRSREGAGGSGRSNSTSWAASTTRRALPPAAARSNWWRARAKSRSSPATWQLLRGQRKDAERRKQEVAAENRAARDALKGERKKVADARKEDRAHAGDARRSRGKARPPRKGTGAAARALKGSSGSGGRAERASSIDAQSRQDQARGGACRT